MQRKINKLIRKYKNKKIVFYGAGQFATENLKKYDFTGLNVIAIADIKFEQLNNSEYLGYKTILPKDLVNINFDTIIILNKDSKYFTKIVKDIISKTKNKNAKIETLYCGKKKWNIKTFFYKNSETVIKEKGFPNGHYYSPVPSMIDCERYKKKQWSDLKNINLNAYYQENLLNVFGTLYKEFCFPYEENLSISKYYLNCGFFDLNDAITLNLFLRHFKPSKIIEVGSGFSTLCMVETARISNINIDITCIEPYPDRLKSLVDVENDVDLHEEFLQNVDSKKITEKLKPGDLLFIDSSHVYKYGSDVMYIFKKILPNIPKGVFVHFHDVPFPFEYHDNWVDKGWYWSEAFFLEQFLAHNNDWEIVFWPSMLYETLEKKVTQQMPLMQKMTKGGSIFIRRVQ